MDGGIKFGQLLGLADHLTFSLNYEVIKLVVYLIYYYIKIL